MNEEIEKFKTGRSLLLRASMELFRLLSGQFSKMSPVETYQELQLHLELLMDKNETTRREAFDMLTKFLHMNEKILNQENFKNLDRYFDYCHSINGGNASWTRVLNNEEREKYVKWQEKNNPYYY